MARDLEEWVGRDDNTPVPDRVRVRVFDAKDHRCHRCTRKVMTGERWTLEHIIALINWRKTEEEPHGNRESNLGVTCCNCLPEKNADDMAEKSAVYEIRKKHILPREAHPAFRRWGRR